jgi:hypothetical protein
MNSFIGGKGNNNYPNTMQQTKMTIVEPSQFDDYEPVRCTNINEGYAGGGGLGDLPSKLLAHAAQSTSKKRKKLQ